MCALKSNGLAVSNGNGHNHDDNNRRTPITLPIQSNGNGKIISGFELLHDTNDTKRSSVEVFPQTEILTGDTEQFGKIQKAVYDLLDAFNVNWDDPNYTDTPKRVAKAYMEYWASGYGREAEDEITTFPNTTASGDLVLVKDMKYYSLCSHHLAPFHGYGAIAYLPGENLLGLSKLGRILDIFARRFQLQERIGAQTADKIMELLNPQGVMVMLYDSEHMCMSSRGVQLHEANTTTVATRGIFKEDADLRREVLTMMNR
ncbi:MAG: GTP cyclohydrolase I [Anaerolineae bacterium]|nr:GTP cyclohydrolase I [Anaerolineae bacterium]